MTSLHPCLHCHRNKACSIKADTLAKLRGLKISKAKLRCRIPMDDFPVGATVEVTAFELIDMVEGFVAYEKVDTIRRGVVSRWNLGKATIVLNKDQEITQPDGSAIGYLKVETNRLTRVDTPIIDLCDCGLDVDRCTNGDHPSIRHGTWSCWSEVR